MRIGPLSADDALQASAQGNSWGGSSGLSHLNANLQELSRLADVRQYLVYFYHLVNIATSCESADRLELPRISHWKPIWTTVKAEGCFAEFRGNDVAVKRAASPFDIFDYF